MPANHDLAIAVFSAAPRPAGLGGRAEARGAPRMSIDRAFTIGGAAHGERFTLHTVLDNLSATGLYLRLARPLAPDASLFVVVRLAPADDAPAAAPGVAARCQVVRMERCAEGGWGIAMRFTRQRFLYAVTT